MKDFIKANLEKVMLIVVMAVLVVVAVFVVATVDVNPIELIKLSGSQPIEVVDGKVISGKPVKALRLETVFENRQYLLCRDETCNKVFHDDFRKCPWCKTQVDFAKEIEDGDSDGDGILDTVEAEYNMDPNNPDDALEDRDKDGFSNYDEITVGINGVPTLIDDPSSYPSMLNFIQAIPKKAKPLQFIYKSDQTSGSNKALWEVQFVDSRRKTRWVRVGGVIFASDYSLVDIEKVEGKVVLSVKKEGAELIKVYKGKYVYPPNGSGMVIYNNLGGKQEFVADDSKHNLLGLDGVKEVVDFRGWRRIGKEKVLKAIIFSRKTNEEFEIDSKKSILSPVK
ncbi:hypothetical protein PQO03_09885 [Lentisphaera profundi]|uniref:EF-hand domain-containing protein n=1 Tax=Lentisphaera profundi TaxID=1658616 RepID=A0ABY7VS24_9BACT|nr:hypothetical protein [Lentisphaera profundi]WDE96023.1 hypothetical protein PQO03_09885 [Lentisphaera profundi]